jgi:hypothetical protein
MKQVAATLMLVVVGALVAGSGTNAGEKKEKTLKGTLVCGKCTLGETKKCCNVLQVKEDDKTVNYFLKDKGAKEAYHKDICPEGAKKDATVKGVISEKDEKKFITPSKNGVKIKKAD